MPALVNSWFLMSSYMQVDRDTVTGESLDISRTYQDGWTLQAQQDALLLTSRRRHALSQQVRSGMLLSSYTVLTTLLMHDAI